MPRVVVALAVGAIAAIALAGCGPSASPTPLALPADLPGDHVLLRVEEYGGLAGWQDASTPRRFSLTADGTLLGVTPGVSRMPAIRETHLDPAALAAAWATIGASGVARDGKLDIPGLFDADSSFITVDGGGRATTLQVYGLGVSGDVAGPGVPVPAGDVPARRAVADLLAELAVLAAGGEPVDAPRLALYIANAGDGLLPAVPWTGALDLAAAGGPVSVAGFERCAVLEGDHAAAAAEFARALPADRVVEQGGARWAVGFRPLFADEADPDGCVPA
ncbi:MAG TPA: hypothetical protein VFQ75_04200 [Candidatus Limnocylindrales bacterium]|nr:hypothetical protein [Candidatus Limnocylindrales bacterium]